MGVALTGLGRTVILMVMGLVTLRASGRPLQTEAPNCFCCLLGRSLSCGKITMQGVQARRPRLAS